MRRALCAIPAIGNAGGNGLVEGTQRRRSGNLRQDISEIFFTGAKRFEAQGSVLSEIGRGETLDGFAIVRARVAQDCRRVRRRGPASRER